VGIVSTVDNFGSMGDQPSNQPLLDYLARTFLRDGLSTKKLVRQIVLTRAYRLGTEFPPAYRDIDPANHLVWRHSPRRLEAEEIRDSMLESSGQLDLKHPDGSPAMTLRMIEIRDDGPVVNSILSAADRSQYRSVYLPLLRGETPRTLAAFDPVVQTLVTGQREATTAPSQALFMLNSPFVRRQSLLLAKSLLTAEYANDAERIREAYERVLGREPGAQEIAKANVFLARYSATWLKAHGASASAASPARIDPVSCSPCDITAGIARFDGLGQDDEVLEAKPAAEDPSLLITPGTPVQAAWGALVQALYGSAEFQFVR
jgi:hypothetical protein